MEHVDIQMIWYTKRVIHCSPKTKFQSIYHMFLSGIQTDFVVSSFSLKFFIVVNTADTHGFAGQTLIK